MPSKLEWYILAELVLIYNLFSCFFGFEIQHEDMEEDFFFFFLLFFQALLVNVGLFLHSLFVLDFAL